MTPAQAAELDEARISSIVKCLEKIPNDALQALQEISCFIPRPMVSEVAAAQSRLRFKFSDHEAELRISVLLKVCGVTSG